MNNAKPIRVLIADDHPIMRAGIVRSCPKITSCFCLHFPSKKAKVISGQALSMLNKEPDIRIMAETGDGEQVARMAAESAPDVLVLDVNMPGLDPVGTTRHLKEKYPALQVLILTAYYTESSALLKFSG